MRSSSYAIRLGLSRGLIETRNALRHSDEWSFNIFFAVVFAIVLYFQRDTIVDDANVALAAVVLPGILGMMIALGGLAGVAGQLSVEREDGTLLRAKAVPNGMIAYVVAKIVVVSLVGMVTLAIILAAGLIFVSEILSTSLGGWLMLVGVLALGLLATLPWGMVIGSLLRTPQGAFAFTMLPMGGLAAISGIFYPITAMAGWVQAIAQVFPVYWLGHGMRAALIPDAEAAEIGGSWRYLEMLGVLGAWAVVGLVVAPPILRRMARRESGSAVEQRRHEAMQRYG